MAGALRANSNGWASAMTASAKTEGINLRVTRAREGRSGDPAFLLDLMGEGIRQQAVFKVFNDPVTAQRDLGFLKKLSALELPNYIPVDAFAFEKVSVDGVERAGTLMEMAAGGRTFGRRLTTLPPASAARTGYLELIGEDLERLAHGLASAHRAFESGEELSPRSREEVIDRLKTNFAKTVTQYPQWAERLAKVLERAELTVIPEFRKAKLKATVPHNDAHLGNFLRDERGIRVIDVSNMSNSIDVDGKPSGAGENDVGRLVQSLQSWPDPKGVPILTEQETAELTTRFLRGYASEKGVDVPHLEQAMGLQRVQFELAVLRFAPTEAEALQALVRLEHLLFEPSA